MCVAAPGRILSIEQGTGISRPATARFIDGDRQIDLAMVPEAGVGDHVIVHSGYAIRLVPIEEAHEALRPPPPAAPS